MINTEGLQSQTIRWLRFPLAVAVVFTHNISNTEVNAYISQIDWLNLSGMDVYNSIQYLVSCLIARCARPCFFIFSGFLFFQKINEWNKQVYFEKIKRRVKTLIIPYLLWNIIPLVIMFFFRFIRSDGSLTMWFDQLNEKGILKVFWNYHSSSGINILGNPVTWYYPYNWTLWFVRDLIVLSFLSPLIYYFLKNTKLVGIVILGICFCTQVWIFIPGFIIDSVFFFSFGAFFSIHGKMFDTELSKGKIIWLLLAMTTMILTIYYHATNMTVILVNLFIIAGSITTINFGTWLMERGWINGNSASVRFLAKTSFFIFVMHTVFLLQWSNRIVNLIIISDSAFFLILKYLTAPFLCVCICVGLYYLADKIAPKLLKVLTGNR